MKTLLHHLLIVFVLGLMPTLLIAQAPNLGTAANYVIFSTDGGITNSGHSLLTGNVGCNIGDIYGFGNVNGKMDSLNGSTAQAAADLLSAYIHLDTMKVDFYKAPLLGNGDTLIAGVYHTSQATSLNLKLNLDAKGNANAIWVFQIQGTLSTSAFSEVKLLNGAKACNVFWKVEGLVSLATGTIMRGTLIANNAAIEINSGSELEGRALSTTGAISVDGILAYTPIGCGTAVLTGPAAPVLRSTANYTFFSANGGVTNTGITKVTGDVGTNVGLTIGFDSLLVKGAIHPIPDVSTATCSADLTLLYDYLNTLPYDIELLYPATFGSSLTLTPHTYLLDAATVLTDTLFLDAQGNSDAVFVIQISGALTTSVYSNVVLKNQAQAKNVYWKVDGAVEIDVYSEFCGTLVANNGAIRLNIGSKLFGRALSTAGSVTIASMEANPGGTHTTALNTLTAFNGDVSVYPNPFSTYTTLRVGDLSQIVNCQLRVYNIVGEEVFAKTITSELTTIETSTLPSGIYLYKVIGNNKIIQSGKLVSRQ